MPIQFFNNDVNFPLRDKKKLKNQILQIFDLEGFRGFCGDTTSQICWIGVVLIT